MLLLVPWKTGWVNATCVAYAMLQGAVALGLWRRTLWGWRLGLLSGLIGLASGVLIITGLLLSWVYLRGIYGGVGYGAAVLSLLVAAVVFEVVGLVLAMQLRALLRREVRGDFRPATAVQQAMLLLLLVPLVSVLLVAGHTQYTPVPLVTAEGQAQSIAVLRAALQDSERPAAPALVGVPLGPGPLYVSLWQRGELLARVRGDGPDLAAAVDQAASALRPHAALPGDDRTRARLKVDRVRAVHTLLTESPLLVAVSVVPGQDGLRRREGTTEQVLLPDDMLRADRFGQIALLSALPDARLGLDTPWALARLPGPARRARTAASGELGRVGTWHLAGAPWHHAARPGDTGGLRACRQTGRRFPRAPTACRWPVSLSLRGPGPPARGNEQSQSGAACWGDL